MQPHILDAGNHKSTATLANWDFESFCSGGAIVCERRFRATLRWRINQTYVSVGLGGNRRVWADRDSFDKGKRSTLVGVHQRDVFVGGLVEQFVGKMIARNQLLLDKYPAPPSNLLSSTPCCRADPSPSDLQNVTAAEPARKPDRRRQVDEKGHNWLKQHCPLLSSGPELGTKGQELGRTKRGGHGRHTSALPMRIQWKLEKRL
ncbi:hypothetical protein QBC34DRAFT_496965 [Podospora aff. communis PSN243]|uniref:Uncharacterized protein n=1 Tax=Podospora aff. communis PSN243 TaxID=3040156 RepID=A0AAV9GCR5_9PEZI|nr:hypothetical protein QBC34DRAFT_496965 [Podospora aff. communis PSN243]